MPIKYYLTFLLISSQLGFLAFASIMVISGWTFDITDLFAKNPQTMDAKCNASDFNTDNVVNGQDLSLMLSNYKTPNSKYDIWGEELGPDGSVNVFDLSRTIYCWLLKRQNPVCGDGEIDFGEQCDPPGGMQCGNMACKADCSCPASPSPTPPPSPTPTPSSGPTKSPTPSPTGRPSSSPTPSPSPSPSPSPTPTPQVSGTCNCNVKGTGCGTLGIFSDCIDFDENFTVEACMLQNECTGARCCAEGEKIAREEAAKQGATITSIDCTGYPSWVNSCN